MRPTFARVVTGLGLAVLISAAPSSSRATVLDFETIIPAESGIGPIPDGYGGFNWDGMVVVHQPSFFCGAAEAIGEFNAVSFQTATISLPAGTFDFNSAYLAAACRDGLHVNVEGLRGGAVLFFRTVVVDTTGLTFFEFDYDDIDTLRVSRSAGVGSGCPLCSPEEMEVVIDNFAFNEPIATTTTTSTTTSTSTTTTVTASSTTTTTLPPPSIPTTSPLGRILLGLLLALTMGWAIRRTAT
jgi:hypothetical protein